MRRPNYVKPAGWDPVVKVGTNWVIPNATSRNWMTVTNVRFSEFSGETFVEYHWSNDPSTTVTVSINNFIRGVVPKPN